MVDILIPILYIRTLRFRELNDLLRILKLERAELGWWLDQSRSTCKAVEATQGQSNKHLQMRCNYSPCATIVVSQATFQACSAARPSDNFIFTGDVHNKSSTKKGNL